MASNSTVPGGAVDNDGKWIPTSYHDIQVENTENDKLENCGKLAPGIKLVTEKVDSDN